MIKDYPIPLDALDDRAAWLGTSGSGKSYNVMTALELLGDSGHRFIAIDPMDVMYGLRLGLDGKTASRFTVPIFGGKHGDLPLTASAGALIGETVATMAESAIICTAEIKEAANERRFMLAFLRALYRYADTRPVHLILDEADMWAPQLIMDKTGEATTLLGQVSNIVRRGRVRGFIPWLISQRPAALSKDVLSQLDTLVTFQLTIEPDVKAVRPYIGADLAKDLPGLAVGTGIIYAPRRGIQEVRPFPLKTTYDSSRTPKRGEHRADVRPRPLDVGALRHRLAAVEAEAVSEDPAALRKEIARLRQEAKAGETKDAVGEMERREAAYTKGRAQGALDEQRVTRQKTRDAYKAGASAGWARRSESVARMLTDMAALLPTHLPPRMEPDEPQVAEPPPAPVSHPLSADKMLDTHANGAALAETDEAGVKLNSAQTRILAALAWWKARGHESPRRPQIGALADMSPGSGHFGNVLASLVGLGLVTYPEPGRVTLTEAGEARAPAAPAFESAIEALRTVLKGRQLDLFNAMVVTRRVDDDGLTRAELAEAAGMAAGSGHFGNIVSSLATIDVIAYPKPGRVRLNEWTLQ